MQGGYRRYNAESEQYDLQEVQRRLTRFSLSESAPVQTSRNRETALYAVHDLILPIRHFRRKSGLSSGSGNTNCVANCPRRR